MKVPQQKELTLPPANRNSKTCSIKSFQYFIPFSHLPEMYVYLAKKVRMPDGVHISTMSWHSFHSSLAIGGDNLLKILYISDNISDRDFVKSTVTLDGHNDVVDTLAWCNKRQTLLTSDTDGLVVTWGVSKGDWFMQYSNLNSATLIDACWSPLGNRICMIYDDGSIVLEALPQKRQWQKQFTELIRFVRWTSDGKGIILLTVDMVLIILDPRGSPVLRVPLMSFISSSNDVSLDGSINPTVFEVLHTDHGLSHFVIFDDQGHMFVFDDAKSLGASAKKSNLFVTKLDFIVNDCSIHFSGKLLAVTAKNPVSEEHFVAILNKQGEIIFNVRNHRDPVSAITFSPGGHRLAYSVNDHVFFAGVVVDTLCCAMNNATLCYSFSARNKWEYVVVFWNTMTDEKNVKYYRNLEFLNSAGSYALLLSEKDSVITKAYGGENQLPNVSIAFEDDNVEINDVDVNVTAKKPEYLLSLCNNIGVPLCSIDISEKPLFVSADANNALLGFKNTALVWKFNIEMSKSFETIEDQDEASVFEEKTRLWVDINDSCGISSANTEDLLQAHTKDPIVNGCVTKTHAILVLASGVFLFYSFKHNILESRINLLDSGKNVYSLKANCDGSRLALITTRFMLFVYSVESGDTVGTSLAVNQLNLTRKDVHNVLWSKDDPHLFASTEKSCVYIIRDLRSEEPIETIDHLLSFEELTVKTIAIHKLFIKPSEPALELLGNIESRSLRDARHLLDEVSLKDAFQFINDNPHDRLWRMLGRYALSVENLDIALKAFIRCSDYPSIQFVKSIHKIKDNYRLQAKIYTFLGDFDIAERLYLTNDRLDLALSLRQQLGDYSRMYEIIESSRDAIDVANFESQQLNEFLGKYFFEKSKYSQAVEFLENSTEYRILIDSYFYLNRFEKMVELKPVVFETKTSSTIQYLSEKFLISGQISHAVDCLIELELYNMAVDLCVEHAQWGLAMKLYNRYKDDTRLTNVSLLREKLADHLIRSGKIRECITLSKIAGDDLRLAKLIMTTVDNHLHLLNNVEIKKLLIVAVLRLEVMKTNSFGNLTVDNMFDEDDTLNETVTVLWNRIELTHLLLLAHRHVMSEQYPHALSCMIRIVTKYSIPDYYKANVYSLMFISALYSGYLRYAAEALIQLEGIEKIPEKMKKVYRDVGIQVFSRKQAKNPKSQTITCPKCVQEIDILSHECEHCQTSFNLCVASGLPLFDAKTHKCKRCSHHIHESLRGAVSTCPMCHNPM
ncbi:hypothetical protein PCE1_004486 [Barthelona sp. PCE]